MSIKPEPTLNLSPLPLNGGLLRLSGRDALAFAQAQFANDVTLLADGQWQWSLWLSPKGRVLALFALLRLDAETLVLWLPDTMPESFAEQLQRFRFRSKLAIEVVEGIRAYGVFTPPSELGLEATGSRAAVQHGEDGRIGRIALDMGGASARTLLLQADGEVDASDFSVLSGAQEGGDASSAPDDLAARWRMADIAHGLPRLEGAGIDAFTPHMLGLDRLNAFSVKKGCYPGQEIVARTHFLGQAKRGPLRLLMTGIPEPGARLTADDGAAAQIVSLAQWDGRIEALVVGPCEHPPALWQGGDGISGSLLPLLDGLAR